MQRGCGLGILWMLESRGRTVDLPGGHAVVGCSVHAPARMGKDHTGETQVRVLSSNGKRVHCSITWRVGCHNCRLGLQIQMRCMQETRGSGEGECRGGWRGCVEYGMCGGCVWWRKPMLGAPVLHAMRSLEISMHGSAVEATRSKGSGPKRSEIEKPRATVPPRLDHAS